MTGRGGILAALGAMGSSLATLLCCLPAGFLGAAGLATLAATMQAGQPWLLGLSFLLLGAGFIQAWRAKRCGMRPNRIALALLVVAGIIVVLVAFFPQVIAGWLADAGSGG